jgi:hypothetical protein
MRTVRRIAASFPEVAPSLSRTTNAVRVLHLPVVGGSCNVLTGAELFQSRFVAVDGDLVGNVPEQQAERRIVPAEGVA